MADTVDLELNPTVSSSALKTIEGSFSGALTSAMSMIGGAASAGAGIVGAGIAAAGVANPKEAELFGQALKDVTGVIGQVFVPVLQVVTQAVRFFGDLLASILPSAEDMAEVMAPIAEIFQSLKEALNPILPIIKDVLVKALQALAWAVRQLVDGLKWALDKLGLGGGGTSNWKSSVGAASQRGSFVSADQLGRGQIAGAFGMGGGPMDRVARATEENGMVLKEIRDGVKRDKAVAGFPNQ